MAECERCGKEVLKVQIGGQRVTLDARPLQVVKLNQKRNYGGGYLTGKVVDGYTIHGGVLCQKGGEDGEGDQGSD